ncbi:MAG TPA: DUF6603 domain-containing protein [Solirubrobacteraceae bacterium]|nr:DUF6603 domain-containing protein [Solirubrobacteraceae bacterium]
MSDAFRLSTDLAVAPGPGLDPLVRVDVLAAAGLDIPGLKLTVDGIAVGVGLRLDKGRQGNHKAIEVVETFKPPTGAGAEVTLPAISGGGYLAREKHDLRGVLAADLHVVRITGFGLLGLEDPPSLLVLLAGEFRPGIQLSFGFTLVGIGGILGINRRADRNELAAAVSSGDLGKLLFPRDPVAEAPRLLSTLDRCFPKQRGGLVAGPFVKIGWGTPTMLAATLGVIVSTADGGVIIVGRMALTLPFEDVPLIRLQMIVLGTIDANGVAIDGSLVDSHVVGIAVEGDLRLRMLTGGKGLFALSAGGFHPAFHPPDGMSGMRRLAAEVSPGALIRLRLEAYAAITTSSLQFGARVEVSVGIDGFGIHGHAGFDALFVTEPSFGFVASLTASVSVECADFNVCSIDLFAELAGPSPWRVKGHAHISILFWDVPIDIPEITWGGDPESLPPARDPLVALMGAMRDPANWHAASARVPHLAMLRPGVTEKTTALHPLSAVEFRQRTVPLWTELERMDGVALAKPTTISLEGSDGTRVSEGFVPSQFFALKADEQLAASTFRDLPAGLALGAAAHVPRAAEPEVAVERKLEHEQKVLAKQRPRVKGFLRLPVEAGLGLSTLRFAQEQPPRPALVKLVDEPPVVATTAGMERDARFAGLTSVDAVRAASVTEGVQLAAAWEVAQP